MKILNVSVDRLTFVGGISDRRLLDELRFNPFVKGQGRAKFPYDYTWYMQDGSVLQLANPTGDVRPLRYDFNPNRWEDEFSKDYHIMSVLRCMKNVVPTRIDVAIDVDIDLGRYKWRDNRSRKREMHESGTGRLETLYIGSERSATRFRIYDKAKERTDKESVPKYPVWWRVEVQLRGEDAELFEVSNPFKEIMCQHRWVVTADGESLDVKTKAILHYLTEYPDEIKEFGKEAQSKYRKLLSSTSEQVTQVSFAEIYQNHKEKVREVVDTFKHLTAGQFNYEARDDEELQLIDQLKKEITLLTEDDPNGS